MDDPGFSAQANPQLARWSADIQNAARITGLDPSLIAAVMWAESRGDPNAVSKNPGDGNSDLGLMQISNERWKDEILPNLTPEQRAMIKELTGLDPEQLDMSNPKHNVIGGALELQMKIKQTGSVEGGLAMYVSGSPDGNPTYVRNVLQFQKEAAAGQRLSP